MENDFSWAITESITARQLAAPGYSGSRVLVMDQQVRRAVVIAYEPTSPDDDMLLTFNDDVESTPEEEAPYLTLLETVSELGPGEHRLTKPDLDGVRGFW